MLIMLLTRLLGISTEKNKLSVMSEGIRSATFHHGRLFIIQVLRQVASELRQANLQPGFHVAIVMMNVKEDKIRTESNAFK